MFRNAISIKIPWFYGKRFGFKFRKTNNGKYLFSFGMNNKEMREWGSTMMGPIPEEAKAFISLGFLIEIFCTETFSNSKYER